MDQATTDLLALAGRLVSLVCDPELSIREDIDDNPKQAANKEELQSIHDSLGEYARSERTLKYIAFVGHYSSGKSSTINSLLDEDVQEADQNPTDRGITQITQHKNRKRLLANRSKGGIEYTPKYVNSDLVAEKVIIDTPGSGDATVFQGVVRHYLPIANLIYYVFSAANPGDDADRPILTLVSNKLKFIPYKFIITRSDEFKKDGHPAGEGDWFSVEKQVSFEKKLTERLAGVFGVSNLTPDRFIYIDNRAHFGIDRLRQDICDDQSDATVMHADTLNFFRDSLREMKTDFLNFIATMSEDTDALFKRAQDNREKFDEGVGIETDQLVDFWTKRTRAFAEQRDAVGDLSAGWRSTLESVLEKIEFAHRCRKSLVNRLGEDEFADYAANELEREARNALEQEYNKFLIALAEKTRAPGFNDVASLDGLVAETKLGNPRLSDQTFDVIAQRLAGGIDANTSAMRSRLKEATGSLVELLSSVTEHADKGNVLTAEQRSFDKQDELLRNAVNKFRQRVVGYKAAIMGYQMKHLSARTRLSRTLDDLDTEQISDGELAALKEQYFPELDSHREQVRRRYSDRFEETRDELDGAISTATAEGAQRDALFARLKLPSATVGAVLREGLASALADCWAQYDRLLETSCRQAVGFVAEAIANAEGDYSRQRQQNAEKNRNRRRFIIWGAWLVGGGIVTLAFTQKLPTIFQEPLTFIIQAAVVGIALPALATFAARRVFPTSSNLPKDGHIRNHVEKSVSAERLQNIRPKGDALAMRQKIKRLLASTPSASLDAAYQDEKSNMDAVFASLRGRHRQCSVAVDDYVTLWHEANDAVAALYSHDDVKAHALRSLSEGIKDRSIEPSFKALEERKADLEKSIMALGSLAI